ncbi:chemotaxis protein CheX [Virgibacillus sp. W0430]|uniref:chemotaxis protein CheX n=1 Tax=Virgibacillus sp. W0430 TaxID=3391580 RepID=UPI003F45BEA3
MTQVIENRNHSIKELLNGTTAALKMVVPLEHELSKPSLLQKSFNLQFGVFIGITGDIKGKLILEGNMETFGNIGQTMFGMPIEQEMLRSFSGELGNMLAGNLSSIIEQNGINIDITAPTILQGDAELSGYELAIKMNVDFYGTGDMAIYLLVD